jgi:glutamine synthetase
MLVFTSVISAIDKHYDLLRLSTGSLSNDLRLGGDEAPPSVVSVFIGDDMLDCLNGFVNNNKVHKKTKSLLDIKTSSVAKMYKDNCDRNRTSPFAYTGNKFEFRMVGSSQSVAFANTTLLTIVANEFERINKLLENKNNKNVVKEIIVDNITKHSRVIFNGNSYDEKWYKEAEKRGIVNYSNCLDVYSVLHNKENIKLFENCKVLNEAELNIKYDTFVNEYINKALIEAKTLTNMCRKNIIPSINKYILTLVDKSNKCGDFETNKSVNDKYIKDIDKKYNILNEEVDKLSNLINSTDGEKDTTLKAYFVKDYILKSMNNIRIIYDELEEILPNEFEPFPTYNEILF